MKTRRKPTLALTAPLPDPVQAANDRRRAIRDSGAFTRAWGLLLLLQEADDVLATIRSDLNPAAIFSAAGLPPAQNNDAFGNDALDDLRDSLDWISDAFTQHLHEFSIEIAKIGAPDDAIRPAA